jgi:hypothetical protein
MNASMDDKISSTIAVMCARDRIWIYLLESDMVVTILDPSPCCKHVNDVFVCGKMQENIEDA